MCNTSLFFLSTIVPHAPNASCISIANDTFPRFHRGLSFSIATFVYHLTIFCQLKLLSLLSLRRVVSLFRIRDIALAALPRSCYRSCLLSRGCSDMLVMFAVIVWYIAV